MPGKRGSIYPISAVLMAGGASTRFGSNKLLADWRGKPLIQGFLERFPREAFCRAVVVTRYPEVEDIALKLGYEVLLRPGECQDISGTIRAGLSHLEQDEEGCLFSVCDQPLLTPGSILRLAEVFQQAPSHIWAMGWQGQRGNPVIFPKALYSALLTLPSGASGNVVIQSNHHLLEQVEAASCDELADVDTTADLSALL